MYDPANSTHEATTFARLQADFGINGERASFLKAAFEANETDDEALEYAFGGTESLNPEAILMAKEEMVEEVEVVQFVGVDMSRPVHKTRETAMPASSTSRQIRVAPAEPLDTMWRTFLALARFDERKERMARRKSKWSSLRW